MLMALLAAGCSGNPDLSKVDPGIRQILAEVDAKQYGTIYDNSDSSAIYGETRDAFIANMQMIDTRMGACQPPVEIAKTDGNATRVAILFGETFTRACASGPMTVEVAIWVQGKQTHAGPYVAHSPLLPETPQSTATPVSAASSNAAPSDTAPSNATNQPGG
jgi:hypothetical protein